MATHSIVWDLTVNMGAATSDQMSFYQRFPANRVLFFGNSGAALTQQRKPKEPWPGKEHLLPRASGRWLFTEAGAVSGGEKEAVPTWPGTNCAIRPGTQPI